MIKLINACSPSEANVRLVRRCCQDIGGETTGTTHKFLLQDADVRVVLPLVCEVRESRLDQRRERTSHLFRLGSVRPVERDLSPSFVKATACARRRAD